jgi:hypothetical protein
MAFLAAPSLRLSQQSAFVTDHGPALLLHAGTVPYGQLPRQSGLEPCRDGFLRNESV